MLGLTKLDRGVFADASDRLPGELFVRVDPGPHRRSPQRQATEPVQGGRYPLISGANLDRPAVQFLVQAHGHGIHEVGPAGLHDPCHFFRLGADGFVEIVQGRQQLFVHGQHGADMHGRGDHVVTALAHVDVVVRVHTQATLAGHPRNHLVAVHVGTGAGAGLEYVDWKLGIVLAGCDGQRGILDSGGDIRAQQTQLVIGIRSRPLDQAQGANELTGHGESGNREIVHRPLGLGTP